MWDQKMTKKIDRTIQVKGGNAMNLSTIRDFANVIESNKAVLGIMIGMKEPTPEMKRVADQMGYADWPTERKYPRYQILFDRKPAGEERQARDPRQLSPRRADRRRQGAGRRAGGVVRRRRLTLFSSPSSSSSQQVTIDPGHSAGHLRPQRRDAGPQSRDVRPQSRDVRPQRRDAGPQSRDVRPKRGDVCPLHQEVLLTDQDV